MLLINEQKAKYWLGLNLYVTEYTILLIVQCGSQDEVILTLG